MNRDRGLKPAHIVKEPILFLHIFGFSLWHSAAAFAWVGLILFFLFDYFLFTIVDIDGIHSQQLDS